MRPFIITVLGISLALAATACTEEEKKAAGESCEATEEGAAECESNVCVSGTCPNNKQVTVCGGDDCTANKTCAAGSDCVELTNLNEWYCIPSTVCN